MNTEIVIDEARGFLKAIATMCEPNTTMWINSFPMRGDFEASVVWYINKISEDYRFNGKKFISYKELQPIINTLIFEKIVPALGEKVVDSLKWKFKDFYFFASFVENESNHSNPLVSEASILIELSSSEYKIEACYITPVGKNIVVTTLGHTT